MEAPLTIIKLIFRSLNYVTCNALIQLATLDLALMCTTAWLSADHFTAVSLLNFENPYRTIYHIFMGEEQRVPCDKSRPKHPRSRLAPETLVGHRPGECADVGISVRRAYPGAAARPRGQRCACGAINESWGVRAIDFLSHSLFH